MAWRPRLRPGLRHRVVLWFGLLGFGLSLLLAVTVWVLLSRFLVTEQESTALTETSANATAIQRGLSASQSDIDGLLAGLPAADGRTAAMLRWDGTWHVTPAGTSPDELPAALLATAEGGRPAQERVSVDGTTQLAVALPLSNPGDVYVELYSLSSLNRVLLILAISLVAGVVLATGLGLAVGRAAGRRALRPLDAVSRTAARLAAGDLRVRLDAGDDPDLVEPAASFNRTAEALQQRVEADTRFAADVSHELRTPLTTMLNSMQLLQARQADLPPALREPLELLAAELDRFRQLVVDLLEISRDSAADDPGARETVVLGDLVRHSADSAAGRPVTSVDPDVADALVLADKRRLSRVVANLVDNAELHGGGCLAVRVLAHDGRVRFEVDDAGPGVPEDRRTRVFDRFARDGVSGGRGGRGVGLGLAIVAQHVRWHGGAVTVLDRPGGGARFVVDLPVVRSSSAGWRT
ncbi:HAMP domain-containing sensor histidine kinase [Jiangella alba]|uniref:histidine kinase n=1 Tax=Jiangella alba TaxID=561176 RepID=A0A1H5MGS2_9ACTN|nr:HAMP domain-containing sensor histidine kinase [Jiangella alba]SEE88373.1 Signal transduction histidine kinase [Jiangella alba]